MMPTRLPVGLSVLTVVTACAPDAGLTKYNAPPTAVILAPTDGASVAAEAEVLLRGAAGDPNDDPEDLRTSWFIDDVEQCTGPPEADSTTECTVVLTDSGPFSVRLEVLDPGGAAATDTITLDTTPNLAPTLSVDLSPLDPHTDTVLSASPTLGGVDPSRATFAYVWRVDGAEVASGPDDTLDGALHFERDQSVEVEVTATVDATEVRATSDAVTILNSAPSAPELALTPLAPVRGDDLVCTVTTAASDADGDALTYHFSWTVDGVTVAATAESDFSSMVSGTSVGAEETWSCTVVADHGDATSTSVTASVVSIEDCDRDGDGTEGPQCGGPDCDDDDPATHPRAGDHYGDGVDDDCDGLDCEATEAGGVYFVVCVGSTSISAADAEQTCIDAGHDGLSIPLDATENAVISTLNDQLWPLRPLDNHNIRLGGTDAAVEDTWVHTRTGALLTYLNWGGSEPTNSYGNEHCINMIGDPTWSGLWQDLGCFAGSNSDTAWSCEAR